MFQSRNRETYDSNYICNRLWQVNHIALFQSRNREAYDSNHKIVPAPAGMGWIVSIS